MENLQNWVKAGLATAAFWKPKDLVRRCDNKSMKTNIKLLSLLSKEMWI